MRTNAVSSILGTCLAIALVMATGPTSAMGMECAPGPKGHMCCDAVDVEGDHELECVEGGATCQTVQSPKHCNFEEGSIDYCFCKTLQTCASACKVSNSDTYQMGDAAKDLYDHCGEMIKHFGGNDAMDELKVCRQTDPMSYDSIRNNCDKFIKNYCDKMGS